MKRGAGRFIQSKRSEGGDASLEIGAMLVLERERARERARARARERARARARASKSTTERLLGTILHDRGSRASMTTLDKGVPLGEWRMPCTYETRTFRAGYRYSIRQSRKHFEIHHKRMVQLATKSKNFLCTKRCDSLCPSPSWFSRTQTRGGGKRV